MRLHSRIYLHSLVVLLAVAAATSLVFAMVNRGALMRDMGERMARHAAGLAAERIHDPAALADRLRGLHDELDVDVAVRDLDGRVVAGAGEPVPPPAGGAVAAARSGTVVTRLGPMPYAVAPVRDRASGAVVATVEVSSRRHLGPPGFARALVFVTLVLLALAVATRPLARRLSRPLERLTEAVRRLGGGDLGARAPVPRASAGDEIADLTRAFNDMAERVQRLVQGEKELLANISHELRSPLARLRMTLALLPRGGEDDARLLEAERDLAELERLIDDVLATARLQATGLPARLAEVDVRTLLDEVAERARRDPGIAGKVVRVGESEALTLTADEALLRRALWNLVENAAKYGAPPITLGAARAGASVVLTVDDEGPGIPPAARERVLESFYRLDSARTPGGSAPTGFGLGLTFARRVAEVHGGTIAIAAASTSGGAEHGCRVTLTLPAGEGG